ncbi:hypothetical protein Pint_01140 [Pistacia integerrima]|uniref:Uncharacterized protein n=1 Tax=Pistacia integerrima TaxID=434235 RepID=A0ACC0ZHZ9_9ROSI|nr:hypothetical protein Pint_01140 [Pistacia integerrima]
MATSTSGGGSSREGTAKAMVSDQISQAIQSTSNLLHLMQDSSPSQACTTSSLSNFMLKAFNPIIY